MTGKRLGAAAAAGMSERTARRRREGALPSTAKASRSGPACARHSRTRRRSVRSCPVRGRVRTYRWPQPSSCSPNSVVRIRTRLLVTTTIAPARSAWPCCSIKPRTASTCSSPRSSTSRTTHGAAPHPRLGPTRPAPIAAGPAPPGRHPRRRYRRCTYRTPPMSTPSRRIRPASYSRRQSAASWPRSLTSGMESIPSPSKRGSSHFVIPRPLTRIVTEINRLPRRRHPRVGRRLGCRPDLRAVRPKASTRLLSQRRPPVLGESTKDAIRKLLQIRLEVRRVRAVHDRLPEQSSPAPRSAAARRPRQSRTPAAGAAPRRGAPRPAPALAPRRLPRRTLPSRTPCCRPPGRPRRPRTSRTSARPNSRRRTLARQRCGPPPPSRSPQPNPTGRPAAHRSQARRPGPAHRPSPPYTPRRRERAPSTGVLSSHATPLPLGFA